MQMKRALRYLAPNLFTTANLLFGMLSLRASMEGRYVDAGWLIIYAVLTDKVDGFVARLVHGTSELGVQLDSFADFLNFGLAPAALFYASLSTDPRLPFHDGWGKYTLMASCAAWVLAAVFRLARYNISTGETEYPKIFFGVPTTLVGGTVIIWYLALLKYTPEGAPMAQGAFGGGRLFGDLVSTPVGVWRFFPAVLFIGAYLMASALRMPKLGLLNSKSANIFIFTNVFLGYIAGFARVYPEYAVWPPTLWLIVFLSWGALSPTARAMKPPPLFPEIDHPVGHPIRPEDDLLPEHEVAPLDPPPTD